MIYKKLDYNTEGLESLSNSDLKKLADYWLRQYLLKGEKYLWCPIKKITCHKDQIHCCHYYDRGIMSLRYDLKNVHLISAVSNTFDAQVQVEGYKSKHHKDYSEYLVSQYGSDILDFLAKKSKEIKIFYKQDYIDVINKFRNGH